ncbi:MBL fold metallo-hydrolase [Parafannyhessea sp. LCP21S3_E6]|uniref:MBL fold metallo-hydrolase n=1 Tax=unclassified Parafannyhessea TaxID=2847323 RepID=UPI003F9BFED4
MACGEEHDHCCGNHSHQGDGGCCGGHDHDGGCCGGGHEHDGGCCGGHDHDGGCCGGGCCGADDRDQIAMFVVGPIETNCYAYVSQGECLVVDPGNSGKAIAEHLPPDVTVRYIVATHGHGDHVGGVKALREATGAKYAISARDAELAKHAGEKSELGRSYDDNAPDPDLTLSEGDVLKVGTAEFRVLEMPGHTPGGIVLLGGGSAEHVCFVGDTLFKGSCGRTDLAGGSQEDMARTLARLKREIPAHTNVFCGHGDPTTMEDELAQNPYLR